MFKAFLVGDVIVCDARLAVESLIRNIPKPVLRSPECHLGTNLRRIITCCRLSTFLVFPAPRQKHEPELVVPGGRTSGRRLRRFISTSLSTTCPSFAARYLFSIHFQLVVGCHCEILPRKKPEFSTRVSICTRCTPLSQLSPLRLPRLLGAVPFRGS